MKKRFKSSLVILFLGMVIAVSSVVSNYVTAAKIESKSDIKAQLESLIIPKLRHGKMGIYIKSITDNKVLYEFNEDTPLIPASNEKIVTTVGAYQMLGPNYRYKTELYMDGPQLIQGSYYFGDLAIKGYGDPTLHTLSLAGLLKDSPLGEVKNFTGNLYIDDTFFDTERFGRDWHERYVKEIGALILRDANFLRIGDRANILPFFIGKKVGSLLDSLAIENELKLEVGIPVPDNMSLVATAYSSPLLNIMSTGLKMSDNSILEQIFKTISAEKLGLGNARSSAQILKDFYAAKLGLNPEKYEIIDGSGLSRNNSISANYLGKILEYAYFHPYQNREVKPAQALDLALSAKHPYLQALSIAGVDGTLDRRMKGLRVYGKTGTLSGVDAVSGYVITNSNRVVVFSILVNNFSINRHELRNWEDQLVASVAEKY